MKLLKKIFNKDKNYDRGIEPSAPTPTKRKKRKIDLKADGLAPTIIEDEILKEASSPSSNLHRSGRPRQVYRRSEGTIQAFDFPICSTGCSSIPSPIPNKISEEALRIIIKQLSTSKDTDVSHKTNRIIMK